MSEAELFGVFAASLALCGLLAPWAGKLVDLFGGRSVLASSSAVGACGYVSLSLASSRVGFVMSWMLLGLATAIGLYDTCFAALAQAAPSNYRRSVTGVTLIAGLASTVAWPLSHYLLRAIGWRGTCLAYSGALLACSLIYLVVLPRRPATVKHGVRAPTRIEHVVGAEARGSARTLALAFAGTAFIAGAFSAHMIQTLIALRIATDRAVWLASTLGVMQVAGRLIESLLGQRHSARALGLVTFGLLAASTGALLGIGAFPWLVFPFVMPYGTANGLLTIAKAAMPVELLGFERVGATLGGFSAPSLLSRAAAPFGFALLTDTTGIRGALMIVFVIALCSFGALVQAAATPLERRT